MRKPLRPEGLFVMGMFTPGFALEAGRLIVCGPLFGVDGSGRTVGVGDAGAQTRQALANLEEQLARAGAQISDVVRVRIHSVDMGNQQAINAERKRVFTEPYPASSHIQVPRFMNADWLVGIEADAFVEAV